MAKIDIARMKVGVDIEVNKRDLEGLQKAFDVLAVSAKLPGKEMDQGLQEAGQTASKLSDILDQCFNKKLNSLDISKFSQELKKSGLTAESLRETLSKGGVEGASAFNKLTQEILGTNIQLKQSNTFLDKMAVTMANTVRFGISSAVFNKMTSSISEAYNYVKKLDKSLNEIRIVSGASADEMDRFAKKANQAAKELGSTTLDYSKAALIYYQQGDTADQVIEKTNATIKMSNVLGESADQVSDYMTAIWNNFDDGTHSLEYYGDVITSLGAKTASSAEEIAGGLEKFAAIGDTIGLSYEYATAALTTITAKTRQSEDVVGTALKTIFSRIQGLNLGETLEDGTTLNKYSASLAKVGIDIKDANGNLKDMDIILGEMGSKWETLSKDQQVALAQSVAGVRQYNQLIALMDNWDFMQDNLEVAANSLGTLNEQQEIYSESVEAHLNRLQSSWDKVYKTLFDVSEINPLIDGLSSIVDGINGVAESFGGGAKSIAGFGGMFVNVFQNQIDKALTHFISNSNIAKENVSALQLRSQFASTSTLNGGPSIEGQAEQAAAAAQIENAKRLESVFSSISTQDAQRIIDLQNQAVELEKQAQLINLMAEQEMQSSLGESKGLQVFTEQDLLALENAGSDIQDISDTLVNIYDSHREDVEVINIEVESLEKMLDAYDEEKSSLEDIQDIRQSISKIIANTDSELVNELNAQSKIDKKEKLTVGKKQDILKLVKQIAAEEEKNTEQIEKNVKIADKELKAKQKASNIKSDASGVNQQIDATLKPLEKAQPLVNVVNTLTASVSALTSTWSAFNNVTAIWADQDLSFGEQVIQTITTLSMALPGVISAYKTLKTVQDAITASKSVKVAATEAEAVASQAVATAEGEVAAAETAETTANAAQTAVEEKEVAVKTENVIATEAVAGAETIGIVATTGSTVAKGAETVATEGATKAQWSLNAALMANPIIAVATAILAGVAAIAALSAASKKATENLIKLEEEEYNEADAAQQELAQQENLYSSWIDLYNAYKTGAATKEEMAKATSQLTELLGGEAVAAANLSGNYDDLIEKIKQVRAEAVKGEINELDTKISTSSSLMKEKALQTKQGTYKDGYIQVSGSKNHGLSYDDEFTNKDFSQYLLDQGYRDFVEQDEEHYYTGIRAKDDAESLAKLKEYWDAYIKETNDKNSKYYTTSEEKADSEMYQNYKGFIDSYKDDLENYNTSKKEKGEKQAQYDVLTTDFSSIDSGDQDAYTQYEEKRKKLREELSQLSEYAGQTDEELNAVIDKYAVQSNSDLESIIQKGNAVGGLYEKLKGSIADSNLKEDLNTLSLDEIAGLGAQNADLLAAKYDSLIESGMSSAEAIKAMGDEFKILGTQVDSIIAGIGDDNLKDMGLDKEDLSDYSKYIMEVADESDALADTLEDDDKAAVAVAKSVMRMNNGIEKLNENQKDWIDILKKSGKESEEYWKALDDLRDAFGDLFDLTEDQEKYLSAKFFTDNAKDIEAAADGDEKAIERLRNAAAKSIVLDLQVSNGFSDEILNTIYSEIDYIQNNIPNLEVGFDTDLSQFEESSDQLMTAMQNIINEAGLTADQANALFSTMGFETEFETKSEPVVKEGHGTRTVTELKGSMNVTMPDGTSMSVPAGWETKTYPGEPYTYVDYVDAIAMSTDGHPQIKSVKKKGTGVMNNFSSGNKGGGPVSKGGGSSSKPDKKESVNKDKDRYHKVDTQLTKIGNQLKTLEREEEKFFGAKLIDNLNKQLALYNRQIETTTQKISIANGEANELKNNLSGKGVTFNADGTISNYLDVLKAQENYVNSLINNYNSMSQEAQESYREVVEQAEEDYDELQKNLDRYDELITGTIPELEESIQEAIDKQIEIQIKEFDMAIDLHLDLAEAEKEWIDFRRRIIDGIKDDDILGLAQANFDQLDKYFDGGLLADETSHLLEIIDEINIMKNGGKSSIFGDNMQTALDELEKYYKQSMSDLEELQDTIEEIEESFVDMMDKVADEMGKQNDLYSMLSDTLDHDMEVIKLAYGDTSYQELESYFAQKEENLRNQLDFQRQQVELWQQQMDTLEKGSEAWEVAKENWMDAVSEWQSSVETAIENIQEKYANAIQAIFKELNNTLTKGAGLDYINQEWELITKNSEEYLDTINREYQLQKLQAKYIESIDDTDNIAAKRKLNDLMTKELEMLREQDKLSQYDLDRANLKYEIALKRIALEEAQQNKSTMRLRRDSQGNYSYQYTANNDEISSIQQELSDLLNQLYNMDTSQYSDNLSKIYDIWAEYQDKMAEAAKINDPEAREQRELLLNEYYGGLINDLVGSNLVIRNNLYDSAFLELEDLYDEDYAKFATLADAEKEILMTDMIPQWESGIQSMIDAFAGEGGFEQVCEGALQQIALVTQQYEQDLVNLQNTAGVSFESLSAGLDPIVDKTRTLVSDNNALITAFNNELAAISDLLGGLDLLAQKYEGVTKATKEATQAAIDLWAEQKRQAEEEAKKNEAKNNTTNIVNPTSGSGSSGGSGGGSSNPYGYASNGAPFIGTYTVVKGDTLWGIGRKYGIDWNRIYAENRSVIGSNPNLIYPGQKYKIPQYETGGYTGDWSGKDGQLAVLHPRELVLNANDTENMLKAIEMLRDITSGFMYQQLASISAPGLSGINGGQLLEQDVHIEANFPNVSSANEIETALNNLVNAATQHIHTNR